MSERTSAVMRQKRVGVLAAIAIYAAWTIATWLLEGRIGTLSRPGAVGDRVMYALIANLLIGVLAAIIVLRHLVRGGSLARLDAGFGPGTPSMAWLAIAVGMGFTLYILQGGPSLHPVVLTNAFAQVLVVSAAEVIVCWALVGAAIETWLRPSGRALSLVVAAFVASTLFGVYHVAHSPPFNTPGMVVLLTGVGLVTSAFFFLARDVYATILFHNFLAIFGVTQALAELGQLHAYELFELPLLSMALMTIIVLAFSDWIMLRTRSEVEGSRKHL